MPRSKSSPSSRSTNRTSAAVAANGARPDPVTIRERADALFRAALECCRQHERYARVVTSEADDGEERAVSRVVGLCDEQLRAAVDSYERAAANADGLSRVEWWHRANALWLASREWVRRHQFNDDSSRRLARHTPEKLNELRVDYDLETSALLGLQQAINAYRKACPEAELNGLAPTKKPLS